MARHFDTKKLVIASHNPGKVKEIGALLAPFGTHVVSAAKLSLPEPVEDGKTFVANAEIKALAAATAAQMPALADDSGLCVHGLNNDPGVFSARWAGPEKDFSLAMEKIEQALKDQNIKDRSAHFTCALTLAWPDGHLESFEGHVHGTMVWPPLGNTGFGYDPTFKPKGHDGTFAQMEPLEKQAISHRAIAFQKLVEACFISPDKKL